jgi:hypothetical protein
MVFTVLGQAGRISVGIGPDIAFNLVNDIYPHELPRWDWDDWRYDGGDGVIDFGFQLGAHANIGLLQTRAGNFHYAPAINVWFGTDEDFNGDDHFAAEIGLNIFDVRYYPPLPATIAVRPYVGLGPLIAIQIYTIDNWFTPGVRYSEAEPDAEFNICAGADIPLGASVFYGEFRGKVGDWDAFKMGLGLTFSLR